MTSIERLQISGIRSFDPEPSHAQTVHFQKPLTIILGKNGAGKTTIIEALLNACTGAMPPGSGGSEKSSFVYDPKVIGESEVKAQIRLIFTGKDGRNIQVIRSVQVTRARNKTELKTLDNTVAYQDPDTGKVVSNTYRATDVDRVVPELLGVSPSVLKYVVFCHQEESNWPLSPPKDVKEIFDDLFAATRYVATLEKLRKVSQDKRKQLKEYEASLFALREHRNQAKVLEETVARKEALIRAVEERRTGLEPELAKLHKASAAMDAVEQEADVRAREAAQLAGRIDEKREAIARANVPSSTHTREQMSELRASITREAEAAEATIAEKTQQMDKVRAAARGHEEALYAARAQVQVLDREDQQHRQNVTKLRALLASMPESLVGGAEFAVGEDNVDERSLTRVLEAARAELAAAHRRASDVQAAGADGLTEAEERRQRILRAMDADAKTAELTEDLMAALVRQMTEARDALAGLGGDACLEKLAEARRGVEVLRARVAAAEEVRRHGEHHQRRQRIDAAFDAQNRVVAGLRQAMARARQLAGRDGEVRRLRDRLAELSEAVASRLAQDITPRLAELGLPAVTARGDAGGTAGTVAAAVEEAARQREAALTQARVAHATLDRRAAALAEKREHMAERIAAHEAEVAEKTAVCAAVLDTLDMGATDHPAAASTFVERLDNYEHILRDARTACERAVHERHTQEVMAACYTEFTEAARSSQTCAVCERPFKGAAELDDYLARAAERQTASPAAVAEAQRMAAHRADGLARLEGIHSAVMDVRRGRALLPQRARELAETESALRATAAEATAAAARVEAAVAGLREMRELALALQPLLVRESEVAGLRGQLAAVERQAADGAAALAPVGEPAWEGMAYEELTERYEAATAELHRLNEQRSELQRMEDGAGDHAAQAELLDAQHSLHQLELTAAKVQDAQSTLERLNAEHDAKKAAVQALRMRRGTAQRELDAAVSAVEAARAARRAEEQTLASAVTAAESRVRELETAVPPVLAYLSAGGSRRLHTRREEVRVAEGALAACKGEVEALHKAVTAAQETLTAHSRRVAEVDRAMTVLDMRASLAADEARLREVEASLAELKGGRLTDVEGILGESAKHEPLPRLRELIRAKLNELERAQAQQQGSIEATLQDVNDLKAQLAHDKFAKIEKRYRSTFLKAQSEALTLKDADNYYAALEVGVQEYHKEKIAQINQIIGELWRQTYRGSDIDTIEIRSETEATLSTASKRSYTYRVVIKRGDSELDMRGRCSAGQKVLASIIIRLALSETFCFDCGILALDEPTTNLDEDNARSLAESLRSLIEVKRNVKNFQLVVITHDEQFVRALGGHHLEHFHYVHKDRDGAFSIIEKRTLSQLFA